MLLLLRDVALHAPEPRGVQHVLVAGGQVVWIGDEVPVLDPALQVDVVDGQGRVLAPGLVDGHVHVTGGGGEGGHATSVPPPPLSSYTSAGVTTVVGLLGTDDVVRRPSDVLARVHALRAEGLDAWMLTGGYHLPVATVTGDVARDVALLEPVLGIGELALSDHRGSRLDADALLEVATAVRSAALLAGRPGSVHLHLGEATAGLEPLREAIAREHVPVRLWHPTHVNRSGALLASAAELALATGLRLDVTAFPPSSDDPAPSASDAIAQLLDRGVPLDRITCSSDAGGSLPMFDDRGDLRGLEVATAHGLLDMVRALVGRGVPLADALRPVTSTPADQLGLDHVGRVRVGARADLLLLDDDLRLVDVLVGGTHHVRDGQQVVRGTFETGASPA